MLVLSWVWHLLDIDVELYQQFLFTDPNMFKITLQHSSCMPIQGISLLHSLLLFVRLTIHPVAETQKQIVFFVTHTPQETFQLKCAEYDWFPYFKVFILNIWKIWSCVNFVSSGVPSTHFHVPSVSVSVSPIHKLSFSCLVKLFIQIQISSTFILLHFVINFLSCFCLTHSEIYINTPTCSSLLLIIMRSAPLCRQSSLLSCQVLVMEEMYRNRNCRWNTSSNPSCWEYLALTEDKNREKSVSHKTLWIKWIPTSVTHSFTHRHRRIFFKTVTTTKQ